jgi:hypothetical protein
MFESRRVKNFLFSTSFRPALGSTQPPIPGVKRQGRESDHSPPASAEVKKMWIYISTPPIRLQALDNFTFLLLLLLSILKVIITEIELKRNICLTVFKIRHRRHVCNRWLISVIYRVSHVTVKASYHGFREWNMGSNSYKRRGTGASWNMYKWIQLLLQATSLMIHKCSPVHLYST